MSSAVHKALSHLLELEVSTQVMLLKKVIEIIPLNLNVLSISIKRNILVIGETVAIIETNILNKKIRFEYGINGDILLRHADYYKH